MIIGDYKMKTKEEIGEKIEVLNDKIAGLRAEEEDLTNELVINISSDEKSGDDVKTLIDDMENLIDSVKEYK